MTLNLAKAFPSGIATGDAFINREKERSALKTRILSNQHTILMAPRRYGKTSLVTQVAAEMKLPYCSLDLLAVHSDKNLMELFNEKVSKFVFQLSPGIGKAKTVLVKVFKALKPQIAFDSHGYKLILSLSGGDPKHNITELLLRLDEVASHFNKRAVFFIDEFQEINSLKNGQSIEASIRHAVERSKNIVYVFSGSSRHLLAEMFGNSERPLYRLCHMMEIKRISEITYQHYLNHMAQQRWHKHLPEDAFNQIVLLTELHPFYVNVLCQNIWREKALPTADKVIALWDEYVHEQRYIFQRDLTQLSPNQKKVLSYLAVKPSHEIYSSQVLSELRISGSSMDRVIRSLIDSDMLYQNAKNEYSVLDPAVKYFISKVIWE